MSAPVTELLRIASPCRRYSCTDCDTSFQIRSHKLKSYNPSEIPHSEAVNNLDSRCCPRASTAEDASIFTIKAHDFQTYMVTSYLDYDKYLLPPGQDDQFTPPPPPPPEVCGQPMANTAVDVKELPNAYIFVVEVPGLKNKDVKVQIENDRILKISGERKREDNSSSDIKYVRVERSAGKFMRKFNLPVNASVDSISAACQDGLLTIVVPKIPPPEPYKPKTYDIQIGSCSFNT
ncbi:hypothetical protein O6H91_09G101300 [Diphasiastrum complanatum]|uniref:Uncharacterized protein n=1 Tax=Diphasiastrum complanatum TaxID=34168 RepID=A0ACC2CSD9_DIPCM|nr:hypothetical protein O6H91_09G101300 [Diphasiastrum complanatum]